MTDDEKYQKFIEHMDTPIWKFTDSVHKMPMITSFISPEEAEFLTGFPHHSKTLAEIADIKKMDITDLEAEVKVLCRRGLIFESIRGESVRYRLWTAAEMFRRVIFWNGLDVEPQKTLAHHVNRYFMDGWADQLKPYKHSGLRPIPIHETVKAPTEFRPYEDILQVVDHYSFYSVSHCPCRVRHKLDPDYVDSPFPSEVCLHFDELGRYCVENGLGREITKAETLEILKKSADAGLVHGVSNWQKNPDTICNCDLDYCLFFKPYHRLGHEKTHDRSNYVVKSTPESCSACGLCVKRCPMDAIQLKYHALATNRYKKAPEVRRDLCLGCGVCVHKCKTKSIVLERRPETEITEPPLSIREFVSDNYESVMAHRRGGADNH